MKVSDVDTHEDGGTMWSNSGAPSTQTSFDLCVSNAGKARIGRNSCGDFCRFEIISVPDIVYVFSYCVFQLIV